jgi:hypothetical protein
MSMTLLLIAIYMWCCLVFAQKRPLAHFIFGPPALCLAILHAITEIALEAMLSAANKLDY